MLAFSDEWTELIVVANPTAERHSTSQIALHEDPLVSDQLYECATPSEPYFELDNVVRKISALTTSSKDAWELLEGFMHIERYHQLRDKFLAVADQARPPFPLIEDLGGFSLSASTSLIWYGSKVAVCKRFRAGFEAYFRREVEGLRVADKEGVGPVVYEVGENWVVMEYLYGYRPLQTKWYGLLDIATVRRVFDAVKRLHYAGIILFDLKFENCLIRGGEVKIIDYETTLRYKKPVPHLLHAPLFTWRHFYNYGEIDEDSMTDPRLDGFKENGPYMTYKTNWQPHIGLSIDELLDRGHLYKMRRMKHLMLSKAIPLVKSKALDLLRKI